MDDAPPHDLLAELLARLRAAREAAAADPFGDPVLLVALDLSRALDEGRVTTGALATLIARMARAAAQDRAARLAAYAGMGDDAAALAGVAAHGRDFVAQAKANGAVAVLSAGDLLTPPDLPHVVLKDARAEFGEAAAEFYGHRRPATLVGVTGTNGKSSTVDFLRQIWAASGKHAASHPTGRRGNGD